MALVKYFNTLQNRAPNLIVPSQKSATVPSSTALKSSAQVCHPQLPLSLYGLIPQANRVDKTVCNSLSSTLSPALPTRSNPMPFKELTSNVVDAFDAFTNGFGDVV